MFGVMGFICMFLIFSVIRGMYHVILKIIRNVRREDVEEWEEDEQEDCV